MVILISFKEISEKEEKIEYIKEIKKISELENKYNEYEKEINNLEKGLDKGDKNIIENLKQKIYQKDFFYLFHYLGEKNGGLNFVYYQNKDYYLNKFEKPWRSFYNMPIEFKEGSLFWKTCFYLSHDNKILNKV